MYEAIGNATSAATNVVSNINWTRIGRVAVSVVSAYAPEPIAEAASALAPPTRLRFRDRYTPVERKQMSEAILKKRQGVVPIIIEKARGSAICDLRSSRFTVPETMSIASFCATLRKQLIVNSEEPATSMYISVTDTGKHFGPNWVSVGEFYVINGSADGFMYLTYREENAFGSCGT